MNKLLVMCIYLAMAVCFVGCNKIGGDVSLVKNGYLDFDKSITVGQALDGYKSFDKTEWKAIKTEQGRKIVICDALLSKELVDKYNNLLQSVYEERIRNGNSAKEPDYRISRSMNYQFTINNDGSFKYSGLLLIEKLKSGRVKECGLNIALNEYIYPVYSNNSFPGVSCITDPD